MGRVDADETFEVDPDHTNFVCSSVLGCLVETSGDVSSVRGLFVAITPTCTLQTVHLK